MHKYYIYIQNMSAVLTWTKTNLAILLAIRWTTSPSTVTMLAGWWFQPLNMSQLGWLFPIYGKIQNVPNHQPVGKYTKTSKNTQKHGGFQIISNNGGGTPKAGWFIMKNPTTKTDDLGVPPWLRKPPHPKRYHHNTLGAGWWSFLHSNITCWLKNGKNHTKTETEREKQTQ